MRSVLAFVLPHPGRFRLALTGAFFGKPFAPMFSALGGPFRRWAAMLELAPAKAPAALRTSSRPLFAASSPRGRVAILTGCAQPVLAPDINEATIRLLNRPAARSCCQRARAAAAR